MKRMTPACNSIPCRLFSSPAQEVSRRGFRLGGWVGSLLVQWMLGGFWVGWSFPAPSPVPCNWWLRRGAAGASQVGTGRGRLAAWAHVAHS